MAWALLPRPVSADPALAPLPARNLYPPRLLFLQPAPALPELRPGLRLELAYGTVYVAQDHERTSLLLDMEVARVAATGVAQTPWGGSVSLEIPYLWYGGGGLDQPIIGYHEFFGFPDGQRPERPGNAFDYEILSGGEEYTPDPPAGGGLGDLVLQAGQPAWRSPSGAVRSALRLSLKLPTGSRSRGFGSGRGDAGLGLLASWAGPSCGLTFNADALYLGGGADPALRLDSPWSFSSVLSMALQLGRAGTVSAQLSYATSPYGTGFSSLDGDVLLLSLGLRRRLGGRAWGTLGFTEDLIVETSPDFSLLAGLEW